MINKTPFKIEFPLKILNDHKVNFQDKDSKEELFKRNIYYSLHKNKRNPLLEKRANLYYDLSNEVWNRIQDNSDLEILSLSIFGSSLFSENPGDFDFLAIVKGNKFSLEETSLRLNRLSNKEKYNVGISIKGLENFTKGICNLNSPVSEEFQKQIIYRTASALFRRHLPIRGYDFVNNNREFQRNLYAQASDLLNNTFDLYYNENNNINFSKSKRAQKILSRMYETMTYLDLVGSDKTVENLRKIIYKSMNNPSFEDSRRLFNKVLSYHNSNIFGRRKNEQPRTKARGIKE